MSPTDKIKRSIKELVLPGSEAADESILNDALSAFEQAGPSRSTGSNRQIVTWIKRAAAAVIVISILIPLSYGASRVIRKLMVKPAWRGGIVMDFKQDEDIHFDLRVGTKEDPEIVLGRNVRLFEEEGQLLGTLRSGVRSWPKFKWRVRIDLMDETGKSIASTGQVRGNGGTKDQGYPLQFDHSMHFSLGSWDEAMQKQVKKISVKYEQVSEDVATTPDAWIESSKLKVLHGRVTDADGKPVANARVQIREQRKEGQKGIAAPAVFTDERGFYSFDEIRWQYHVGVIVCDEDPGGNGYYSQYKRHNRTLDGTEKVDFAFEEFPRGTAVLTGKVVKPDGTPATEFTVAVYNDVDWKDYSSQYLHQYGFKKYFVSPDGRFEISGLATGTFGIRIILTGKEFEDIKSNLKHVRHICELMDGKTTEVTNEEVVQKAAEAVLDKPVSSYYGRVLYENGRPAVPPNSPWEGAKVYAILRYTAATSHHGGLTERLGDVDNQGYFTANLTNEQLENLKNGKYKIEIYHPSYEEEMVSSGIGTFPAEMLTQDRDAAKSYIIPFEGEFTKYEDFEQTLKSYDMLHELGSVLLKYSDKHRGKFPASLNDVVSFADSKTITWISENVEYQVGRRTEQKAEILPVAYDKTLLDKINGTHVLFSDGEVKFLRRREIEIIDSF